MSCLFAYRHIAATATRLSIAVMALVSSSTGTAAAERTTAATDMVDSQLIVLFDPTSAASPAVESLIAAINTEGEGPATYRPNLGGPVRAEKLLRNAEPLPAAEVVLNPLAPRALLERYVTLTYATPAQAASAKEMLAADPQVLSVETNIRYSFSATPSDEFFGPNASGTTPAHYQWGMHALNFPAAWSKERGFAYIAAIDTGIATEAGTGIVHPDLQQNYRVHFSANFRPGAGAGNVIDCCGHGSHVAGIMAATPQFVPYGHTPTGAPDLDRSTGVTGACWTCSLSMLAANPMLPEAVDAIRFAADHGIQVINMSWGDAIAPPPAPAPPPPLAAPADCADAYYTAMCQALAYAAARGVVMVGAGGNHNQNRVQFPASHPGVIAVGGIEYTNTVFPGSPPYAFKGKFWNLGYGLGTTCSAGVEGSECGSNYGLQIQVVAPAKDVYSTIGLNHFFGGVNMRPEMRCGDNYPYLWNGLPGVEDYYGTCTGTSMAAPHVSGLAGLIRSANPLADPMMVRMWIAGYTAGCENWDLKCGAGIPNAALSVQAALGHENAVNRSTPLFAFYSSTAKDHFYTTIPQMANAALQIGMLLPQPAGAARKSAYGSIGITIPNYPSFPTGCTFSPCPSYDAPKAIANIMTTHVSPVDGTDLTPLYRYSFACVEDDWVPPSGPCHDNPKHISHVYATNLSPTSSVYPAEHSGWTVGRGYRFDGIEGYVFPPNKPAPTGTVFLCRKYDAARDDYVLFTSSTSGKSICAATNDGYTGGSYQFFDSEWIGYVYPPANPQPLCPMGVSCA